MWDSPNLIPIVNVLGLGILGAIAALGTWWGKRRPSEVPAMPANMKQVDGALVDSTSVKLLAASIEALVTSVAENAPDIERRHDEQMATARALIAAIEAHGRAVQANTDERKELRWSKN